MKRWKRTLAALLAAIMLMVPFGATAELALEFDDLPETGEAIELEIAPEADVDVPDADLELELDDALALDGLGIEDIDLEIPSTEDTTVDGMEEEAEAANSVQANDSDSDFEIDENGVLVEYYGKGGDVVIPDGVTSIGGGAFAGCESLTSITIPDSVTSIGAETFCYCITLKSITIPNSVASIGGGAFAGCESLTSITIPDSVTSIGSETFCYCIALKSITIPNSVISIGEAAFANCDSLTSVTIPDSVTSIGEYAFDNCTSLISVTIYATNISINKGAFNHTNNDLNYYIVCNSNVADDFSSSRTTLIHNEVFIPAVEPTYTEPGNTEGTICTVCGEVLWGQEAIPKIELSKSSIALEVNQTDTLEIISMGDRSVAWSSSDGSIASVVNGTVTAVSEGKCTIYATFADGHSLSCNVTVTDPASLSKDKLTLDAGNTFSLSVEGLSGRTVTWTSSDKKVATVKDGIVTAIKAGKCTITAKVKNGKTFKCKVTVKDAAKLNKNKLSLKPGGSSTLKISGLYGRKVTWTSSDKKVATVKDGKVTAVYVGKCTITAQIKNGRKLTCKVTVTDPAELYSDTMLDPSIEKNSMIISSIDSGKVILKGGLNRDVTWSISNTSLVKITKSNNKSASIKALKTGTAILTAKIKDGKTLKCKIYVVDPLEIEKDSLYEESVYNKLYLNFYNFSKKEIVYVTFDIKQYNNRGDVLKSPYSYYYLNESINPFDYLRRYYWVNDDTKKVKISITEVTFSDKTTWKP